MHGRGKGKQAFDKELAASGTCAEKKTYADLTMAEKKAFRLRWRETRSFEHVVEMRFSEEGSKESHGVEGLANNPTLKKQPQTEGYKKVSPP